MPKPRTERGQSRILPEHIVERLLSIKEANPTLSVKLVIQAARACTEVPVEWPLPPSTVHRLLRRHGLMHKAPAQPTDQDRRRFAFHQAGQLWMSDVMHGPRVGLGNRTRRKTYLIAFIGEVIRVIP